MRGDRFTMRRGELVDLSRERRCNSRAIKTCFRKTRQRMANGYFRRLIEEQLSLVNIDANGDIS
jgi:hypothetical protein